MKLFVRAGGARDGAAQGPNPALETKPGTEGAMIRTERTFLFDVDLPALDDGGGESVGLSTNLRLIDFSSDEFLQLNRSYNLQIGLKVYEGGSRSAMIAEFRAVEVARSDQPDKIKAKFSLPRSLFAEHQCRLVQIDLVYETKFWFAEVVGPAPYLPIWVERAPREVDIFEYYFKNYGPK